MTKPNPRIRPTPMRLELNPDPNRGGLCPECGTVETGNGNDWICPNIECARNNAWEDPK